MTTPIHFGEPADSRLKSLGLEAGINDDGRLIFRDDGTGTLENRLLATGEPSPLEAALLRFRRDTFRKIIVGRP
jgi:hypothetical protein